jgi:hypothetical protein
LVALCDGRLEAVIFKMPTIELAIQDKVVKATPSPCRIPDKVVEATPSFLSHGRVHLSTDSGYESAGYARRHAKHQLSSIYQFLDKRFKKRLQLESQLHDNESDEIPQLVSDSDDDSSPL